MFSRVYIALIRSGESAGVLDKVLHRLADNLEKQYEFAAKKRSVDLSSHRDDRHGGGDVCHDGICVPQLTSMYTDFGASLPPQHKYLLGFQSYDEVLVRIYWSLFDWDTQFELGENAGWRMANRYAVIKNPNLWEVEDSDYDDRVSRTIALLIGAGVSLLSALEIVADSLENVRFRVGLAKAAQDVEKGVAFAEAMSRQEDFHNL